MAQVSLSIHSSFIKTATYNEEKECLRLQMGDYWYYYYGVTINKIRRFRNAVSKGQYFCKYIKGKYEMRKRRI